MILVVFWKQNVSLLIGIWLRITKTLVYSLDWKYLQKNKCEDPDIDSLQVLPKVLGVPRLVHDCAVHLLEAISAIINYFTDPVWSLPNGLQNSGSEDFGVLKYLSQDDFLLSDKDCELLGWPFVDEVHLHPQGVIFPLLIEALHVRCWNLNLYRGHGSDPVC